MGRENPRLPSLINERMRRTHGSDDGASSASRGRELAPPKLKWRSQRKRSCWLARNAGPNEKKSGDDDTKNCLFAAGSWLSERRASFAARSERPSKVSEREARREQREACKGAHGFSREWMIYHRRRRRQREGEREKEQKVKPGSHSSLSLVLHFFLTFSPPQGGGTLPLSLLTGTAKLCFF